MCEQKTPDYEEKVSLDLPPGTTLEDLGDVIMQAKQEPEQDAAEDRYLGQ